MVKNNSGNVLFLILIAVALFAALSYVVTQSSRSGSGDTSNESTKLQVARIQNYFVQLSTVLQRMQISDGVPIENIDFRYDAVMDNGTAIPSYQNNPNCAVSKCEVFNPLGGGMPLPIFLDLGIPFGGSPTQLAPGYMVTQVIKVDGIGTDKNDIVVTLNKLRKEVCRAYNDLVGITAEVNYAISPSQAWTTSNWDSTFGSLTPGIFDGQHTFSNFFSTSCVIHYVVFER